MLFNFIKCKKGCLSIGWNGACASYGLSICKGIEL